MNPKKFAVLASAVVLVLGTWARANLIVPGAPPVPPDLFVNSPVLLASLSTPVAPITGAYTGTLTSAVYRDASGTLEFDYQFANDPTSTDSVTRITMDPFTGFITDGGHRVAPLPPFVPGGVPPVTVDRNVPGDTVGFNFGGPVPPILPGLTSTVLVIATNATNFSTGFVSVIDGGATTVHSFAPAAPVPAPVSTWGGLALIGGLAARKLIPRRAPQP